MIPLMKSAFLNEPETIRELASFIASAERLSMHVKCLEFESEFARYQGRSQAVLFNSGGSANLALIQALRNLGRINLGDRVGFSALTWATNVMPLIQLGMTPIPLDIAPKTLNTMSIDIEHRLDETPLEAVFLTNAMGMAGDLGRIRDLCNSRGMLLLEDNCEALGTQVAGERAGNFGVAATFSFFVAHHMSTIEGGMVCTDDPELARMLRIVRANGWDRNLAAEDQIQIRSEHGIDSELEAKYTFYDLGFNLRPTEITGFLGVVQLRHLESNVATRQGTHLRLEDVSKQNPDLFQLDHEHLSVLSSFAFPVVTRTPDLRSKYLAQFGGAGVEIRPMIAGNIQEQPFYKRYVSDRYDLPGTDFIHNCGFYFGNYPELTELDIQTLSSCLKKY